MKIPQYQRKVEINALKGVPATQAAFGADVATAKANQSAAIAGVASKVADHITRWQKAETHKRVLDADSMFRLDLQDTLHSTEMDENNRPNGFLNRTGDTAKGATREYDEKIEVMKQKYSKDLPKGSQNAFLQIAGQSSIQSRNSVINHEAGQVRSAYNASVNSNIKLRVNASSSLSSKDAADSIRETAGIAGISFKQVGHLPDEVEVLQQDVVGTAVLNYIANNAEGNFLESKKLFEAMKKDLAPKYLEAATKAIDGAETLAFQKEAWSLYNATVPKGSDGFVDYSKITDFVARSFKDTTPEKIEKIEAYVRNKAGVQDNDLRRAHASQDYAIEEKMFQIKDKGGSLDDANRVASEGRDATTIASHKAIAAKIWDTPTSENVETYMELWRGVMDNTSTMVDIKNAYKNGEITSSSYKELSKDVMNMEVEGVDTAKKATWDVIEARAKNEIKKNVERAEYLFLLKTMSKDMTLEQTRNLADDLFKRAPYPGKWRNQVVYKYETKLNAIQFRKHGDLDTLLGRRGIYDSIKETVTIQNDGREASPDDVANWILHNFEDEDAVRPGTPVNNAIESIKRLGEVASKANIDWMIDNTDNKDGIWRR